MANTSATGGFLTPDPSTAPLYDDALDDVFQALFVGITGLDGSMVRPRFQVRPPKQPDASTNWCAVGVMDIENDAGPVLDQEQQHMQRHETVHVLASFYGPNGRALATQARDGLGLLQNNESLASQLMLYINNDTIRKVPELVGEQWVQRYDLPLTFRRQIKRTYAVEYIVAAGVTLITS